MEAQGLKRQLSEWKDTVLYVVRDDKRHLYLCILLGLLSNGFVTAANPLTLKYLFDEGIIRGDFRLFVILSFVFVAVFAIWRGAVYYYRIFVQDLKNEVVAKFSLRMLGKYYRIPYGEVIKRDRGYFLSRIYDEVMNASPLVIDVTLQFSNMLVTLVVAVIVALSISVRASMMVLIAVPVVYFLSNRYSQRIKRESIAEKEEEAKVRGVLERAVGSYKTARIFGLEGKASDAVGLQIDNFVDAFFSRFKTSTRFETLSGIFMSLVENFAIISAGYEILQGRMSFGGFMGFMSAFWAVMNAVSGLFGLVPRLSQANGMVERLKEFEAIEEEVGGVHHGSALRLDKLSFGYGGQDEILSEVDLVPGSRERVLVIGPNGSGKSTLAHVMAGLLQPTAGTMTTFPLDRISAVVLPYDFVPGTVRDNLAFVPPEQSDRMRELADLLGMERFFDRDPAGLSAGQRKRLEILMVLAKPADLYIVDEPLAGVDVESKEEVMRAILDGTEGKNLFVIMHGDPEFYQFFDRILDLSQPAVAFATPAPGTPGAAVTGQR